jgi:ankyrin repeat protein
LNCTDIDINSTNHEGGKTQLMLTISEFVEKSRYEEKMYEEQIKPLLEANADVNIQDNSGYTAIMFAISKHLNYIVRKLIEAEADLSIMTNNGENAMEVAARFNNLKAIEILAQNAEDLDCLEKFKNADVIAKVAQLKKRFKEEERLGWSSLNFINCIIQ